MTQGVPQTVGRYEVQREIGRGMMGVVYEAHDPLLGRRIALKTIQVAFAITPEEREAFEQRFFTEARISARLSHPNIVVVHDVGRDEETGLLFIALEYLEGRPLAELVKEGVPLEWREALQIVRKVAEALHHAHSEKIVHRDIKPANIMILPTGEPKLMDFGIAKIETARMKLTGTGQFFGTPLYMSPEQALGRKMDGRTDLFSLGAVTYEALTGYAAFAAQNLPKIMGRVIGHDPEPPTAVVPELPAGVDYVVARALAKSPDDRYPDGKTMAEDIEDILSEREPRHQASWAPTGALPGEELELEMIPEGEESGTSGWRTLDLEAELATLVSASAPEHPGASPRPRTARRASGAAGLPAHTGQMPGQATWREPRSWISGARGLVIGLSLAVVALGVPLLVMLMRSRNEAPASPGAQSPGVQPRASSPTATPRRIPEATEIPRATDPSVPPGAARPTAPKPSGPSPSPTGVGSAEAARLSIGFEHGLKSGVLRVWIDDEAVLEEELDSRMTKKIIVLKKRKGEVEQVLDVTPGKHAVKVQVAWEDNVRTKRIVGSFKPGATRYLEVRLGGLLKRNLSLEWR